MRVSVSLVSTSADFTPAQLKKIVKGAGLTIYRNNLRGGARGQKFAVAKVPTVIEDVKFTKAGEIKSVKVKYFAELTAAKFLAYLNNDIPKDFHSSPALRFGAAAGNSAKIAELKKQIAGHQQTIKNLQKEIAEIQKSAGTRKTSTSSEVKPVKLTLALAKVFGKQPDYTDEPGDAIESMFSIKASDALKALKGIKSLRPATKDESAGFAPAKAVFTNGTDLVFVNEDNVIVATPT